MTKHVDIDQYKYSGYGIGFDRKLEFSFGNGFGRNYIEIIYLVEISGVHMSSSVHVDNKKKYILILGKGPTQGLNGTILAAENFYSINFPENNKKFCLSLHYNGANCYLFVYSTEIYKFKAKDSEIVAIPLCLRNISKDFSVDNIKKTRLNGYVYDFNVNYDAIAVDDMLDIHKYLLEKNNIKRCLDLLKNVFFTAINFFGYNTLKLNSLECTSWNNQEFKIRSEIINVNSNKPVFYPCGITINKCKGSCNDPYAKLCVPDTIKNINLKVINLMSRNNETRHTEWHRTCKCKCRLDASVCNNKQRWNEDKCRCECKELIDKGICDT